MNIHSPLSAIATVLLLAACSNGNNSSQDTNADMNISAPENLDIEVPGKGQLSDSHSQFLYVGLSPKGGHIVRDMKIAGRIERQNGCLVFVNATGSIFLGVFPSETEITELNQIVTLRAGGFEYVEGEAMVVTGAPYPTNASNEQAVGIPPPQYCNQRIIKIGERIK